MKRSLESQLLCAQFGRGRTEDRPERHRLTLRIRALREAIKMHERVEALRRAWQTHEPEEEQDTAALEEPRQIVQQALGEWGGYKE